jgi:hypothetical protein
MATIMTYTIEAADDEQECHNCGDVAVVVVVADYPERETGYTEEIALCDSCLEKQGILNL